MSDITDDMHKIKRIQPRSGALYLAALAGSMLLLQAGCTSNGPGSNDNLDTKSCFVLSTDRIPVNGCLVRILCNDYVIDTLTDTNGFFKIPGTITENCSEFAAELTAAGFRQKNVILTAVKSTPDTFYLTAAMVPIVDTAEIFIASIPPVAHVVQDSIEIGKTNTSTLYFNAGIHSITLMKKNCTDRKTQLDLLSGKNPSVMFRLEQ